ncbi:MAG: hypothetical protein Tsb0016_23430 [Sphingomonadales bacterium]
MAPRKQSVEPARIVVGDARDKAGRQPHANAEAAKPGLVTGPLLRARIPTHWWAAIVALAYGISGALWIIASDSFLHELHLNAALERDLQTYKGWLYVGLSTLFLYLLLLSSGYWLRRQQAEILRHHDRMDLALRAARGGTWQHGPQPADFYMSPHLKLLAGLDPGQGVTESQWWALVHPDDLKQVENRLQDCLRDVEDEQHCIFRLRHVDGRYRWISATGKAVYDDQDGSWRVLGFGFDITKTKQADERIQRLLQYDRLTGLPNLSLFKQQLGAALAKQGQDASPVLCVRLEIQEFIGVNHMHGAKTGDRLLRKVAARLQKAVATRGLAAHLTSDEFALFIDNLHHSSDIRRLVGQLMATVSRDYRIDKQVISLAFNMGIAIAPEDGRQADALLMNAELAMNNAAKKPGNQIGFYAKGMTEAFRDLTALGQELQKAVESAQLEVHFQPIMRTHDQSLYGFEALLRWRHPKRGLIPPNIFIPLAEESGLIAEIGKKVLRDACAKAVQWSRDCGLPIAIAVNVSPLQLETESFVGEVRETLRRTGLTPSLLELEVTESALIENMTEAVDKLQKLQALGIGVAIDDFGTGYSSLHNLRELPVNKLKIDRSFIQDLETSADSQAIVTTILSLAQALCLRVTAEGVERADQLAFLNARACDTVQGYYLGKPSKIDDFTQYLPTLAPSHPQRQQNSRRA